jgi:hypothetical protein
VSAGGDINVGRFESGRDMYSKAHRILDGSTALFFLGLAILLFILAKHVQMHDGNYAAFYLGAGVWLECVYLAAHFALRPMLFPRIALADRISQALGLLLIPVGLIILLLAVLIVQSIRATSSNEPEVQTTNWIFASLVLFLLVVPTILILRNVVILSLGRRTEADSPVSIEKKKPDNSLEERVTQGLATYIAHIKHDAANNSLEILLVNNPEDQVIDRILSFKGVEDFSEEIYEAMQPGELESLIGLDEHNDAKTYVIHTDARELIFVTNREPTIEPV